MSRKACHKENRARASLGRLSKYPKVKSLIRCLGIKSLPQRKRENPARALPGGPSKCPGKLATKRTVPGPC